jgi:hypothetical protein
VFYNISIDNKILINSPCSTNCSILIQLSGIFQEVNRGS